MSTSKGGGEGRHPDNRRRVHTGLHGGADPNVHHRQQGGPPGGAPSGLREHRPRREAGQRRFTGSSVSQGNPVTFIHAGRLWLIAVVRGNGADAVRSLFPGVRGLVL